MLTTQADNNSNNNTKSATEREEIDPVFNPLLIRVGRIKMVVLLSNPDEEGTDILVWTV